MGIAIVHEIFLQTTALPESLESDSLYFIPVKGADPDTIGIGFPAEGYIPKVTRDFISLCRDRLRDFTYRA
jgi:hypothetical protein